MLKTPLQPLSQDQKRVLAAEIKNSRPGEGTWFRGLSILWLHLCLEQGVKPAEARARDGAAFRNVEREWAPAVAKLTGLPYSQISAKWAWDAATHAAQIHARALQERAEEQGQAQQMLATE